MPTPKSNEKRVPGRAVDGFTFTEHPDHETIWAMAAGVEGRVHIAVCCETTGGGTVQLYSHDVDRRRMRRTLDVARALGEPSENGHATHGKIHFSLCPSADGYLYAATHCSTPPRGDHIWHAHPMWNDREKSFTGAHFFRVHPLTDDATDFGRLFPNEGVGVMALDDAAGCCVGVTYPTGRMFFIDKDGKNRSDLGRVDEPYALALVPDGNGYVYSSDTYGFLLRVNMRERSVEHLSARIPPQMDSSGRFIAMCDGVLGPDGHIYFSAYMMPRIFRLAPNASGPIEIEELGSVGGGPATGLCFGGDGMLYVSGRECHLNRFDVRKRRNEDLGILHVNGAPRRYWRCVRGNDGRLYAGECGRKPVTMLIIDPAKL